MYVFTYLEYIFSYLLYVFVYLGYVFTYLGRCSHIWVCFHILDMFSRIWGMSSHIFTQILRGIPLYGGYPSLLSAHAGRMVYIYIYIYIYIYTSVNPCISMHEVKRSRAKRCRVECHSAQPLWTDHLKFFLNALWNVSVSQRHARAGADSHYERLCGTGYNATLKQTL